MAGTGEGHQRGRGGARRHPAGGPMLSVGYRFIAITFTSVAMGTSLTT
jgi:hypothetical protein